MSMTSDLTYIPIMMGTVIVVCICAIAYQRSKIVKLSSFGGEFFEANKQSRAQGNPLCVLIDKGSHGIPFVATISEKNDHMLESPKSNKRHMRTSKFNLVAPQAAQTNSQIDIKGLGPVSVFTNPYHFAQNIHNSAALCAFGQAIENDPYLGKFRNTLKMIELCHNRTGTFRLECKKYIRESVEFNIENGQSRCIPFQPRKELEE